MDEWHIGDPVDWGDGWMDAQNWGHGYDDEDDDDIEDDDYTNSRLIKRDEYSKKAWDLYMDFKEAEALEYIDMALDLDNGNSNNWNKKAIILEAMKRYRQSEECYDRSLDLSFSPLVCDNKARMLYDWASNLLEESKKLPDGTARLKDAKDTCIRAIHALPHVNSEEDPQKYKNLMESIDFYIGYEGKFQANLQILKGFDRSELFTITGKDHYLNVNLTPGMPLKLVREPDNEFDSDAIAVYAGNEKAGYVANSDYTKFKLTSSASELCNRIGDSADGKYLMYLDRNADIQFAIGRITSYE